MVGYVDLRFASARLELGSGLEVIANRDLNSGIDL